MTTLLPMLAVCVCVFLLSGMTAYALVAIRQARLRGYEPPSNGVVRLRGASGMYRTRFCRSDRIGWWFASPLARDNYVPLRPGEALFGEAPAPGGAILFQTVVDERDPVTHEVRLRRPSFLRKIERRQEPRDQSQAGRPARVGGAPAEIVDRSEGGIRLLTSAGFSKGDEVRVEVGDELLYGWVLEAIPDVFAGRQGSSVRVRLAG